MRFYTALKTKTGKGKGSILFFPINTEFLDVSEPEGGTWKVRRNAQPSLKSSNSGFLSNLADIL